MASPIKIKESHEGLLHKEMGIAKGEKISVADLMKKKAKDKREGNTAGEKRDVFALNAKKWGKE
jgi:hypothetical protein